jgi:hypothetical protein
MKRISALSRARALKLETGDTTSVLIEFDNGATGTLATTMKTFPISPDGILQTAAALEAVFKSVDANGAWMTV